jgi:hypothetical protein
LCNSISFPSFNKAKSTASEPDLIINSLFMLYLFYPNILLSVVGCWLQKNNYQLSTINLFAWMD